jgi:hypothetical protein
MNKKEYHIYLHSSDWKEKRNKALFHAGYRCQLCNSSKKLEVHHRTYQNIGNELQEDLTVLCDNCHKDYSLKIPRKKKSQNQKDNSVYLLQKEIGRVRRQIKIVRWSEVQRLEKYLFSLRKELKEHCGK